MHIIHLELDAFVGQHDGQTPIYVARWAMRQSIGGVVTTTNTHLLASYESAGVLHLAHILVESVPAAGEERQAAQERLELAYACLVAALPAGVVREGLALAPGVWADLERFPTDHDLWTWTSANGARGSRNRRLVPRGPAGSAGA